jgi:RNA polymerase sigma-70 factor (family 1)
LHLYLSMRMQENTTNIFSTRIDEVSFKQIYLAHWEKVYAVCYNNIRDVEPAKGMVQDIFKSLWERKDELEITSSVERYLLRAAKLKVFEYLRNSKTRREHDQNVFANYCNAAHCTENEVMFNSLKNKVDSLVDTLPCQCRNVYKMSREQGLTNKEIASALLISDRAVEYHITRALTTLRANLTEYIR